MHPRVCMAYLKQTRAQQRRYYVVCVYSMYVWVRNWYYMTMLVKEAERTLLTEGTQFN